MIKKMTKYSFVIFYKDVEGFLKGLQNLGVMDITRKNKPVDSDSRDLFDKIAKCKALISSLKQVKAKAEKEKIKISTDSVFLSKVPDGEMVISFIDGAFEKKKNLSAELQNVRGKILEAAPWGNFDALNIEKIKELGYTPHFYSVKEDKFDKSLAEKYPLQIISNYRGKIYFTMLAAKGEEIKCALSELKFPDISASDAEKEADSLKKKIADTESVLQKMTTLAPALEKLVSTLGAEADMYLADKSGVKAAEDTLEVFEGFAPTELDVKLKKYFSENSAGAYCTTRAAKVEDNPPIALKNNWFNKMFEPISGMYMPPNYGEHDLTPYFALFYMLFFGFCLGDMGYGIVLVLTGIGITLFAKGAIRSYGKLVIFLGIGSVIMPAFNGTFFGTHLGDFAPIKTTAYGQLLFNDMQMFWFAILFGIFQILFARILKTIFTIKSQGIAAALPTIGWIAVIIWCTLAYAQSVAGFTLPSWFKWVGIAGAVLIFFFTSSSKNIFARIGSGTWAFYDITGVFGDVLSYIRLFGLGTSGGCLGVVINAIGMQLGGVPYIGPGITILFLIFGHTFVLLICCLGAFVHPMRLTFVEFYKNVGFEGGGREYRPLAKAVEKE